MSPRLLTSRLPGTIERGTELLLFLRLLLRFVDVSRLFIGVASLEVVPSDIFSKVLLRSGLRTALLGDDLGLDDDRTEANSEALPIVLVSSSLSS